MPEQGTKHFVTRPCFDIMLLVFSSEPWDDFWTVVIAFVRPALSKQAVLTNHCIDVVSAPNSKSLGDNP
jgi:hypothetical protein